MIRSMFRKMPGLCLAASLSVTTALGLVHTAQAEVDFVLMGKVRFAISQGDLVEAASLLERALKQLEDAELEEREALLRELADIQMKAGLHEEAAQTMEEVAQLMEERLDNRHPDLSNVHETVGDAYLLSGNYRLAVAAYERAVQVDTFHLSAGHPIVLAALERLAELYQSLADETNAEELAEQIQLAQVIGDRTDASYSARAEEVDAGYGDVDADSLARITIYYATDRQRAGVERPNDFYGSGLSDVEYGTVLVSIPREHKPGQVEEPFARWNRENPDRHIVLLTLTTMNDEEVFGAMQSDVAESGDDEAFVFVHGYNLSFSEAARRTAQIAYDLNFDGLPIMYSWASQDSPFEYIADSETVRHSARDLAQFLEDVVQRSGAERIHLVAHGMGNTALMEALQVYALSHGGSDAAQTFDQVVLAAPDMEANLFADMASETSFLAERMTLYASDGDPAIAVARDLFGGQPRAGEAGSRLLVSEHVDTIDVTLRDDDGNVINGHVAYATALADMLAMFWRDTPPDERCGMTQGVSLDGAYWSFDNELCGGDAYLSAMVLLRNKGDEALAFAENMLEEWQEFGNESAVADWEIIRNHVTTLSGQ